MKRTIEILLVALLLWIPFSVACLVAIPVSLFGILVTRNEYARNVLRSMDKLLAALCGWTGAYTLSEDLCLAGGAWDMTRITR